MGSNQLATIALFCTVLFSLTCNTAQAGVSSTSSTYLQGVEETIPAYDTTASGSLFQATSPRATYNDPFALTGDDNILLGTPKGRKVIRRTRRRRVKKLKSTTTSPAPLFIVEEESSSTGASASFSSSTERTGEAGNDGVTGTTTMKLTVIPLDPNQSITEEVSASLPSPSPSPASKLPDPIFKPGHYTRHYRHRKRPNPKASLWRTPNFNIELFDTESTNEEGNNNVDKRESSVSNSSNKTRNNFNMFTSPTSFSDIADMSTDESNPYVNTSLPISTELQNSLQFTLQVLHPLLNSDSVLTEKEPKIPEDKTVALTHSLTSSVAETPIAPDLRFLPTHLRKSHPLLSEDSFLTSQGSASKTGPRVNINGMHSINNNKNGPTSATTSSTTEHTFRNKGRFKTPPSSTISAIPTSLRVPTVPSSTISSTVPTIRTTSSAIPSSTGQPRKPFPTAADNIHLEPVPKLKITELVYPTVVQPGLNFETTSTAKSKPASTSDRPAPEIFEQPTSNRSPPIILIGSDSEMSQVGVESKGNVERPPVFDDLLLEELVKSFQPPTPNSHLFSTTTSRPTSTTSKPSTTTTRKPTTTSTETTTSTKQTTTTEFSKAVEDETSQLLQLLNILQSQEQTTEKITSTSPLTIPTTTKLDNELLKNLELLETLLSPTAKSMIKEAVDAGTTEKIKAVATKTPSGGGAAEGLSDADLKAIYMLLDSMGSTTLKPTTTTTTTTPKPALHPALQGMLTMLNNPWSEIQKIRAQQAGQAIAAAATPSQTSSSFSLPQPPKPVPTTSSLDLLSQLFNLTPQKPQTEKPAATVTQPSDFGLSALLGSLLPKRTPSNREATSGSNQLLNYFQSDLSSSTPPPGPYYWLDMNAFLGNDPNAGPMSGFRPKLGTRDYFLKVRRRRNSMERYY